VLNGVPRVVGERLRYVVKPSFNSFPKFEDLSVVQLTFELKESEEKGVLG
jgi:hypothetical protein